MVLYFAGLEWNEKCDCSRKAYEMNLKEEKKKSVEYEYEIQFTYFPVYCFLASMVVC